jgi:hypothetical protein
LLGGFTGGVTGDALLDERRTMRCAHLDDVVERKAGDRAPGVLLGGQACQGRQIIERVRPRSTWRRTTRCIVVAAEIMTGSLTARMGRSQTQIL